MLNLVLEDPYLIEVEGEIEGEFWLDFRRLLALASCVAEILVEIPASLCVLEGDATGVDGLKSS